VLERLTFHSSRYAIDTPNHNAVKPTQPSDAQAMALFYDFKNVALGVRDTNCAHLHICVVQVSMPIKMALSLKSVDFSDTRV
jgi:hypothetical protein